MRKQTATVKILVLTDDQIDATELGDLAGDWLITSAFTSIMCMSSHKTLPSEVFVIRCLTIVCHAHQSEVTGGRALPLPVITSKKKKFEDGASAILFLLGLL